MRITDGTRHREVLANLARTQRALGTSQLQISSGLRVRNASDDPTAARTVMKLDETLRASGQYRRSIESALVRVNMEETVLDQLGDALARARELATSQGGDTATATTRMQTKAEVDRILEFAVQLGNTRHPDGYLFGGYAAGTAPIDPANPTVSTVPPGQQHMAEIAPGQRIRTNHTAQEVFIDTDAMAALRDLSAALGADNGADIRAAAGRLATAFDSVQSLFGDIGGRQSQLEFTRTRLEAFDLTSRTQRADLEEADMEKTMVELVTRQNSLQAAMLSTSRILGMTLTNYLR